LLYPVSQPLTGLFFVPFAAHFSLLPPGLADTCWAVGAQTTTIKSTDITSKKSRNGYKTWYTFEWGRGAPISENLPEILPSKSPKSFF
jgi:hypothetical protein